MNEFGYRIYCLRKKNHLTQAKLADMIGITCGAVSSWESGRCIPSHDMTEKIAKIFGTTSNCLLGLDHDAVIAKKEHRPVPLKLPTSSLNYNPSLSVYDGLMGGDEHV